VFQRPRGQRHVSPHPHPFLNGYAYTTCLPRLHRHAKHCRQLIPRCNGPWRVHQWETPASSGGANLPSVSRRRLGRNGPDFTHVHV
jgi:hypothetical protein